MTGPAHFWEIRIPQPLSPDLADTLRDELAIDFFGLSRPEESTVGHRILRVAGDDVAVVCVRRWHDHSGFSIELLSSIDQDDSSRYEEERTRILAAFGRLPLRNSTSRRFSAEAPYPEMHSVDISKILNKAYEDKDFSELVAAPVSALQGVSESDAEHLKAAFGIGTIGELATNKYVLWAQAINVLSK